ncbi:MAG: cardiolipin synthase [Leucothrix sp.]
MTTMAIIFALVQLLGVITSIFALLSTRTSQGTIAWVVTLIAFPWLGVPAYLFFGRTRFNGYLSARVADEKDFRGKLGLFNKDIDAFLINRTQHNKDLEAFETLAKLPFTQANQAQLLINGEQTFKDIFKGIRAAKHYVLVQFYIINDDQLGRQLFDALVKAVRRNVRVFLLYDDIGCYHLNERYLNRLMQAGVMVNSFHSSRNVQNRFQLNFRNHRKIVVVDGKTAWLGGHNVGDEYLGKNPKYPNWRDTHIRLDGPAALGVQLSFVEDWHWAADEALLLNWTPTPADQGNQNILVLPSGPSDPFETASLMMQHAMHVAEQRIWIASPYFVPDEGVQQALRLAALRGVDVTILIPEKPDNLLIYLSVFSFVPGILKAGVKILRYQKGFLHQKVFLVDDYLAAVGTANMDNRSFRLNFEITALVDDKTFASDVETMLLHDFADANQMLIEEVEAKPLWFSILSRAAYLSAPIQ